MADTGFKYPSATGEDYNQWGQGDTLPTSNAFASDDQRTATGAVGDKQDYYNFGFSLPPMGNVDGIEVRVEASDGGLSRQTVGIELSWDSGPSYTTTAKTIVTTGLSDDFFTAGGPADTWGRTWAFSQLSNSNFRLRINANTTDGVNSALIDGIQVKVYYTETTTTSTSSSTSTSTSTSTSSTSTSMSTSTSSSTSSTSTSISTSTTTLMQTPANVAIQTVRMTVARGRIKTFVARAR